MTGDAEKAANLQIFDFENILETAFAGYFTDEGLVAATRATITTLQSKRPRLNLQVTPGAGRQKYNPANGRETAYSGSISIEIITDCKEEAKPVHAQYLATVRSLMGVVYSRINGTYLTYHKVQYPIRENSPSPTLQHEKGYWATTLNYDFDFTIQNNAWQLLTENQQP